MTTRLFLGEKLFTNEIDALIKLLMPKRTLAIDISWGFFRSKLVEISRVHSCETRTYPILKPQEILVFSPPFRDLADELMDSSGIHCVESSGQLEISRGDILSTIKVISFMTLTENSEARLWYIYRC